MEPYQAHNLKFRSNILPPKAADFSDLLQATSTPWLIKSNHLQKSNESLVETVVSSNLVTATANLAGLNSGPDKSKQSFEESSAVSNPFSPVVSSSFQSARDVSICIWKAFANTSFLVYFREYFMKKIHDFDLE